MKAAFFAFAVVLGGLALLPLPAVESLASRIAHTDPAKYRPSPSVHAGAGSLDYMALFDFHSLDTNLYFLHRGIIEPKSGIGHHFHNNCEEMFVIFDGEAQFTIDGRTSLLKGPAGAPTRMGHSHAIYNPTDKPVQWMNINVTALKGEYDATDLNDKRDDVVLDKTPVFITMSLDRSMLRNVSAMHGGKGTVQYRRALGPAVFASTWSFVDHVVIPPGASIGSHSYRGLAQFYYVMAGDGSVSLSTRGQQDSAAIHSGDAVPIQMGEIHSFENTGTQPLELMVVGVARDLRKELDFVDATTPGAPRRN